MEFTGKLQNVSRDWKTGQWNITFTINEASAINEVNNIQSCEKLSIKAVKHRNKRSLDANAYCWVILQKIAEVLHQDKMKAEKAMETTPKTEEEARKKCSEAQANFVEKLVAEKHIDKEAYLKQLKVKSFADLTSAQASAIINKLKG